MGIDYDNWIQKRYQEIEDWDLAVTLYLESWQYEEALEEWLAENPEGTAEEFQETSLFERCVESFHSRD